MSLRFSTFLPACAALCVLAASSTASADDDSSSWHRRYKGAVRKPPRFTFELRLGTYYPQIDDEFYGAKAPFAEFFGRGPQFYFGIEGDYTPVSIPYVGRIGLALGWGTMTANGKTEISSIDPKTGVATSSHVGEATSLQINAFHTSVVLRVDEIAKRTIIPFVPYAKVGLGYGLWSSGTAAGGSKVGIDNSTTVNDCGAAKPTNCVTADGLSLGPHIGIGGMLGLNWLDRRASTMGRESSGIKQVYFFGEWMFSKLDYGVNKNALHVGTSSWVLGLALDL